MAGEDAIESFFRRRIRVVYMGYMYMCIWLMSIVGYSVIAKLNYTCIRNAPHFSFAVAVVVAGSPSWPT
jgi:hypothetical protein